MSPTRNPEKGSALEQVTARFLARMPLPQPDADGGKEERGHVLVVAGSPEMPGAAILAATAALRAGAGKLRIATCRSVAALVAQSVPEAMVTPLPETRGGGVAPAGASRVAGIVESVQAVLIGPGMKESGAATRVVRAVLPRLGDQAIAVLDAEALSELYPMRSLLRPRNGRVIITPHAGEMAHLLGVPKSTVERDPAGVAARVAHELHCVVVLKGSETYIAVPGGVTCVNRTGTVGLGTSGSGDTLAGVIAGLAARGATPLQAAAWGAHLHGRAGEALAKRIGPLGFLARELLAEIPALMAALGKRPRR